MIKESREIQIRQLTILIMIKESREFQIPDIECVPMMWLFNISIVLTWI